MERPHSKWFTGSIVAIIVVAGAIFLAGYPFRSGDALKISFITLTNDATSGSLAIFGATNANPDALNFIPATLQTKSHGVWINVHYATKNISLPGHTCAIFTIALPNNHATWRQPVWWCYENVGSLEGIRGNAEANLYFNWQNLTHGKGPHYFNSMMGNSYYVFSPEVTN